MKQAYYKNDQGNLGDIVNKIGTADLLIMISTGNMFEKHVAELQAKFPNIPSIATTGHFYGDSIHEGGVGVVAISGAKVLTGVMRYVSTMPVHDISDLQTNVRDIGARSNDTVCIDFCTGNDAMVLTTMYSVLEKANICLTGGTAFDGKVAVNGTVYSDSVAYALVKNLGGKVKVYKENIYRPMDDRRFIASKTDRAKYYMGELNGRSAKQLYTELLHISDREISTQTFQNPFGKITGNDICIISLKEPSGTGLCCYRQVNDSDVLTLLAAGDYKEIVKETVQNIKSDFSHVSGVFSVNCAFRHLYFTNNHYMQEYLKTMSVLGCFCGFVGNGEHFNDQFVNQSMSCVAFE